MIYWDHKSCDFAYMKQKDAGRYREEMFILRDCILEGHICHIEEGKKLKLGDVRLYPLLFEFNGKKCHAQRLLRRGKIRKQDQQSLTPYFFGIAKPASLFFTSSPQGSTRKRKAVWKREETQRKSQCYQLSVMTSDAREVGISR